jgi:hypothetical protein
MTNRATDLDRHRGMAAQKATEPRRLLADIAANETAPASRGIGRGGRNAGGT